EFLACGLANGSHGNEKPIWCKLEKSRKTTINERFAGVGQLRGFFEDIKSNADPVRFAFFAILGGLDGTVVFGEYSKNHIPQEVYYVPLFQRSPNPISWIIRIASITYADGTPLIKNILTVLDTGTSVSYFPKAFVDRLFSGIWGERTANGDIECTRSGENVSYKVETLSTDAWISFELPWWYECGDVLTDPVLVSGDVRFCPVYEVWLARDERQASLVRLLNDNGFVFLRLFPCVPVLAEETDNKSDEILVAFTQRFSTPLDRSGEVGLIQIALRPLHKKRSYLENLPPTAKGGQNDALCIIRCILLPSTFELSSDLQSERTATRLAGTAVFQNKEIPGAYKQETLLFSRCCSFLSNAVHAECGGEKTDISRRQKNRKRLRLWALVGNSDIPSRAIRVVIHVWSVGSFQGHSPTAETVSRVLANRICKKSEVGTIDAELTDISRSLVENGFTETLFVIAARCRSFWTPFDYSVGDVRLLSATRRISSESKLRFWVFETDNHFTVCTLSLMYCCLHKRAFMAFTRRLVNERRSSLVPPLSTFVTRSLVSYLEKLQIRNRLLHNEPAKKPRRPYGTRNLGVPQSVSIKTMEYLITATLTTPRSYALGDFRLCILLGRVRFSDTGVPVAERELVVND
ncbi:hypothetical protein CLF_112325, partial [Clonorchis sinensis]